MNQDTQRCTHCAETIARGVEACPACGHLYRRVPCPDNEDRTAPGQCAVCGTPVCPEHSPPEGTAYLCELHSEIPVIEGWAQVYSSSTDLEAELVKENLEADGTDARTLSQKDHFALPVQFGDLSAVRVLVPVYEYLAAKELVESHTDASGNLRFACPNCGEAFDPTDSVCDNCGAPLPNRASAPG